MAIPVKLPVFEGPLDLLLHLIDKNRINIYDIPIVEITDQYMAYIRQMQEADLGTMSEFLVMAATLLDIKCRMLLPKSVNEEGEEEDPREELVQRLLEYKMYKYMSYELRDRMDRAEGVFYKKQTLPAAVREYEEPVNTQELLSDMTLERLRLLFESILRRQENKRDPIRSKFGKIEKEEVSLSEKMEYVKSYSRTHESFCFYELLERQCSKIQIVVTFLAILELMKLGNIRVSQNQIFDDIHIEVARDPSEWEELVDISEE
ncbi:MAG: segregation/condensation protein A [Eubacteriales bacterium]|nr:segregation/condensation protein A [Eubacteriales bacterium]